MKNKLRAIHVGITGFPFGNASINRSLTIYKLLADEGVDFLIINNEAIHSKNIPLKLYKKGSFSGLNYLYTTPSPYRADTFLKRRYYNFIGRINEFLLLMKKGFRKEIDIMFFYPKSSFFEIIYYSFFSKIFGFPMVSHYVEYRTAFTYDQNKWKTFNYEMFDKYFTRYIDGVIPISEFLIDIINSKESKKKFKKIPPLIDFNLFDNFNRNTNENYYLYAGNLIYKESIELILDAFHLVENKDFFLYLIVHGSEKEKIQLNEKIKNHSKKKLIKIFSDLEYNNYLELLYQAKALLVPLFDSIQDKARFPNKIGEYTATANPIISTNYGEVKYYFKDDFNALLANKSTAIEFSNKMSFISNYPEKAKKIGLNGYKAGLKYFDTKSYREELNIFVINLTQDKNIHENS